MSDDPRCCGTGTCIINDEGLCWCGQRWDGEKMRFVLPDEALADPLQPTSDQSAAPAADA